MALTPRRRTLLLAAVGVAALVLASRVEAQLRRGARSLSGTSVAEPEDFDGGFHFCRIAFNNGLGGDFQGGEWWVDFPRADINLSVRLSELTRTNVSREPNGEPHNLLLTLTSPELFDCPFIMMTEVGSADLSDAEIAHLREYLVKGGFLWADDFWGTEAWEWWESVIRRALPASQYPLIRLTPEHPLFKTQFLVKETPQIANIGHWARFGDNMERGSDSPYADARAILDTQGRIMVLMTHDTDFGDAFEREGDDPQYFLANSVPGYAFGINALLYAMSH